MTSAEEAGGSADGRRPLRPRDRAAMRKVSEGKPKQAEAGVPKSVKYEGSTTGAKAGAKRLGDSAETVEARAAPVPARAGSNRWPHGSEIPSSGTEERSTGPSKDSALQRDEVGSNTRREVADEVPAPRSQDHDAVIPGRDAVAIGTDTPNDPIVPGRADKANRDDSEFESMPKRRRGCTIVAAVLVFLVLAAMTIPAALYFVYSSAGGDEPGTGAVKFRVEPGEGVGEIASNLESAGVIKSAAGFRMYLRVKRRNPVIQAGEYELRYGMGAAAVLEQFERGPVQTFVPLTLAPGLTVAEQGERVNDQLALNGEDFISDLGELAPQLTFAEATSAEGLCYPETYHVEHNMTEADVARVCLAEFSRVFDALDKSRLAELGVTPYEAVIIASLIEREAKVPDERPVIASVIYNRLRKKMPLQIDATVLYALGRHKDKILYDDLKVDSPYNTYKVAGLPPTPIAAPSQSALEAALNPASTNYIYYVLTDPSGRHAFTDNGAEFERLKADAIRRGVY